jgi:uracil-DNA glycosylase
MIIHVPSPNSPWHDALKAEYTKQYYIRLWKRIYKDAANHTVLPNFGDVFRALNETDPNTVRVVILGQDPYPTQGKAIGRSFGVPADWPKINSSLANILNEVHADIGKPVKDITFGEWAKQGVLMLNTRLTVVAGKPMSHDGIGWEPFIQAVLEVLNDVRKPGVAMLWGGEAKKLGKHLKRWSKLETSHPCKFSAHAGFIGCEHFSQCNEILRGRGIKQINWVRAPASGSDD